MLTATSAPLTATLSERAGPSELEVLEEVRRLRRLREMIERDVANIRARAARARITSSLFVQRYDALASDARASLAELRATVSAAA